jgi:hypothetical protein
VRTKLGRSGDFLMASRPRNERIAALWLARSPVRAPVLHEESLRMSSRQYGVFALAATLKP